MRTRVLVPGLALVALAVGCAPAAPVTSPVAPVTSQPDTAPTRAAAPPGVEAPAPTLQPTPVATATPPRPSPAATPPPSPTPPPPRSLDEAVRTAVGRHAATIGVVVTSLRTGLTFSVNADRRFTSASLYKLFVLEAAEAAIEDGRLDPTETLTVTSALVAADPYADLQAGTRTSVECALETMVEMSGNSAADLLLRRVGASTVSARMQSLGLDHSALSSEGAFTSPGDVARLLGAIARGEAVNPAASQRMLDLLGAQQHNDRLPAPLPLNVRVAHKTGELPGLRHDAGIVFAPSGPYVVVVMVEDAPSESEARQAIVDISESVYAALEPGGPPRYAGLAPRLAQAVFRVSDPQGRLALLGDPRTETAAVPAEVVTSADADQAVRLRPEVVSDLVTLQQAAIHAGNPIWVRSGFRQPTDAEAAKAVPTEWILPCPIEQPQRVADRPVSAAEGADAQPRQAWLGTTFAVSDTSAGTPSALDDRASATWRWLEAHAMEYGFVPALPETADGRGLGHEPWTLRWVGREMAARLRPVDAGDYAARAVAELERAEAELAAQEPISARAAVWGSDACWAIATTSTRGCPSRWYFLGLPLS